MGNEAVSNSIKLTRAEKKDLKKQQKAAEYAAKAQKEQQAEELALRLAGKSDATKKGGVRSDVKAELKELYKNGEISKELYEEAKDYAGKGSLFKRIFGKHREESTVAFDKQATENRVAQIRAEGGPELSKDLQAKVDKAGLTDDDLYQIMYDHVDGDGTVSYSWKKKQPGEADAIKATLKKQTGYNFTKEEGKQIARAMGYKVEKAVHAGKTIRDAVTGGAISSPTAAIKVTQHVLEKGVEATQKVAVGAWGVGAGAAIGTGVSVYHQVTRVEDKIAEKVLPESIETYADYSIYMQKYGTKKGAELMPKIAEFYTAKDGKLNKEAFEAALEHAAGKGSVLNYEEATGLYKDLVQGKIKVNNEPAKEPDKTPAPAKQDVPPPKPAKTDCEMVVSPDQVEADVNCHKVKAGDNWYIVAQARYNAKGEDLKAIVRQLKDAYYEENKAALNKLGINSSKAGFFPAEGKELCIPSKITLPNGNSYEYIANVRYDKGAVEQNKTVTLNNKSNPFKKSIVVAEACDGTRIEANSQAELNDKIAKYKEQNPNKNVIVK